MTTVNEVLSHLKSLGNAEIAEHSKRFFKTGEGEYGHGDVFLGIRVPVIRKAVKRFKTLPLEVGWQLVKSEYHEVRLFALLFMVERFKKANDELKQQIVEHYLSHTDYINNWDLVDTSCHHIVGAWLFDKPRDVLYQFAQSNCLWQRRIAMMTTYYFIKRDDYADALALAKILLDDKHDLIHKVVGWMLREVGNRDKSVEVAFLNQHYQQMPRTMLRYAIEKFDKAEREAYLKGLI